MGAGESFVVGLAGNPNTGKTTLFNLLTGSRQHTGNWPGKTVERKEGVVRHGSVALRIVDLPGTYSLGAASADEAVARDFLLFERPDVVIDVLDATNVERNLYLALQVLETGVPLVLALNMADELAALGTTIDREKLEALLGVPVVTTSAARGEGIGLLLDRTVETARKSSGPSSAAPSPQGDDRDVRYGSAVEAALTRLEDGFATSRALPAGIRPRFCAIRLLEGDAFLADRLADADPALAPVCAEAVALAAEIERSEGEDVLSLAAGHRYATIASIVQQAVRRRARDDGSPRSLSERIDRVVVGRWTGIPVFLLVMAGLFELAFAAAAPLQDLVQGLFDLLGGALGALLDRLAAPALLRSLAVEGIVGGVGSVLVFLPNILLLFLAISLLEDSGYMARAAYVADRFLHALGLHGRSFIPLLLGFGCNVPAILATRTLDNRKDRFITILISPLMSCSARLPVYLVFSAAFFGAHSGLVVFSLYLLGIVVAVAMGLLFQRTLLPGTTSHFVLEFPPYRLPSLRNSLLQMWDRGASYLKKAGTVILLAVLAVWVLANLPAGTPYASSGSWLGRIGAAAAPVLAPAGFGFWQAAVALLFGIVAKEIVIGSLAVSYGVGQSALSGALAAAFTPLSAYAFLVMTLLYVPCAATIAAIRKETGSLAWAAFAAGYTLALGWGLSVAVYQVGRLLGLG